jgi:ABC-type amino acid transport substrate-binding protein
MTPGHLIMRVFILAFTVAFFLPQALADQTLSLGNDAWPPFIIEGQEQGSSEKLVCEALDRAGWTCAIEVDDWDKVLEDTKEGLLDGIAAAWRSPEREQFLLFSDPYLTNRIVPVVTKDNPIRPQSIDDLTDKRVAMVPGYAYGDELQNASSSFNVVPVESAAEAIDAIRNGRADIALMDELVARAHLENVTQPDVEAINAVLAYRELHFAVSRQHPQAEEIIAEFHRVYDLMLKDGAVNEALGVDWLATDLGNDGKLDLVLRSGISFDDLANPSQSGSTYALEQSQYRMMSKSNLDYSQVNYQVEGKPHSSLQSALIEVFGKDVVCTHKEYSSEFDCSKLFKKR